MTDNLLLKAASAWNKLHNYDYQIIYGRKGRAYTVDIRFSSGDFPHLAGFQYLNDIVLPIYSNQKIVDKIIEGKIRDQDISKSVKYADSVVPRLEALICLQNTLDGNFKLFSFIPEHYPFHTSIKADYLIVSELNNASFVFLIRENQKDTGYCCCSTFVMSNRDYRQNQHELTLLKKTKINTVDFSSETLYVKDSYPD